MSRACQEQLASPAAALSPGILAALPQPETTELAASSSYVARDFIPVMRPTECLALVKLKIGTKVFGAPYFGHLA